MRRVGGGGLGTCEGEGPEGGREGVEGKGEVGAKGRGVWMGMPKGGRLHWNFSSGERKSVAGRSSSSLGGLRGSCVRLKSRSEETPRARQGALGARLVLCWAAGGGVCVQRAADLCKLAA